MRDLGVDFVICGHSHTVKYIGANDSETGIQTYICGGKIDEDHRDIRYTDMTFDNGVINAVSMNTKGEVILEEQVRLEKAN